MRTGKTGKTTFALHPLITILTKSETKQRKFMDVIKRSYCCNVSQLNTTELKLGLNIL